jgi:cyclophilin family peptidyl-prolyl cis-trans isomerase
MDKRPQQWNSPPEMQIDPSKEYQATFVTDQGDIIVRLHADKAPVTVNNFVFLARQGFYDDTIFHRVIANFMVQGGDPTGTGTGGPGYRFKDEIHSDLIHDKPGVLSMANAGPNTNGSQFFITHVPTPWLDGKHAVFGQVVSGMDVLLTIPERDPRRRDAPAVKLQQMKIEES